MMSKWFNNILALIILALLLSYLAGHWEELKTLFKFSPEQLGILYLLTFLSFFALAFVDKFLLKALNTKAAYLDLLYLNNAATLLNYVPMKFGTLFRANYLKRHYGLAYAHFATFFLYIIFLMTATAAAIGLIMMLAIYGLARYDNKILAGIFLATIICSLLFLFTPLPAPKGQGKLRIMLRNFLTGRSEISGKKKTNFFAVLFLMLNFLLTALRIGIIYHSMGNPIHPAGYLILGAIGFVVLFIGVTPGALGIRELALGLGAVVLGVPLQIGGLAALIDRAIILSYAFVVGGCCALRLWYKSPTDFEKQQISQGIGYRG